MKAYILSIFLGLLSFLVPIFQLLCYGLGDYCLLIMDTLIGLAFYISVGVSSGREKRNEISIYQLKGECLDC